MPVKRYYVAYGSNLSVGQMRRRCPDAHIVGTGWLDGYKLMFKGSKTGAYLTVEEDPDGYLPVVIWAVSKDDESALDRYEGVPAFYYKKDVKVRLRAFGRTERTVTAFAYIMHEERLLGIPSDYYLDVCAEGYRTFDFDERFLGEAYWYSIENAGKKTA